MDLKEIGFYTLSDYRVMNTSVTSNMKRCELIITEYCNFNCPYCRGLKQEIYGDRKIKELSLEEIKNIIDLWCTEGPVENIRFSGGEPTLHKDIIDIIKYCKDKEIKRITISTNGSNDWDLYKKLILSGANDFSISLDSCCATDAKELSGGIDAWDKVVENIKKISKYTYVTLGVVLTEKNINDTNDIILFADSLGVSDIRIISAAQWNVLVPGLEKIDENILNKYPILKYRVNNYLKGENVRGLNDNDFNKCALVIDDSVIAGKYHFPCVIHMREGGEPIGEVGPNMRQERYDWFIKHNTHNDSICKKNCLDVCSFYNNKFKDKRFIDL